MKKISILCILGLAFCFSACDEDEGFQESNLEVNSTNGEYTCKGNGKTCIARNHLLTCTNDVATISESSECANTPGEYEPIEYSTSFNCTFVDMKAPQCTCSGTGSTCKSGWNSEYFVRCTAGKASVTTCGSRGCDDNTGCK